MASWSTYWILQKWSIFAALHFPIMMQAFPQLMVIRKTVLMSGCRIGPVKHSVVVIACPGYEWRCTNRRCISRAGLSVPGGRAEGCQAELVEALLRGHFPLLSLTP